jgi:hypothetical protein
VNKTVARTVTEYAIRLRNHDGSFSYRTKSESGTRFPSASVPLTEDSAKRQLGMYRKDMEPTVVTRQVVLIEDEWAEL